MAIPFNLPEEQSDMDYLLNQRLTDLYNLLYQILLQRQPLTNLNTMSSAVNIETEAEGALETVSNPDLIDFDPLYTEEILPFRNRTVHRSFARPPFYHGPKVRLSKKSRSKYKQLEPECSVDNAVPVAPLSLNNDWKEVGLSLRQIADNFQETNVETNSRTTRLIDYDYRYNQDLLTTIVSISPFRDSIWSAIFVVGCRMLSNVR